MSDDDELEDEADHTEEADHHPDVKIGDIAHIRGGLSHQYMETRVSSVVIPTPTLAVT